MIRDDFAGPGGWDQGLRLLGHTDVRGIENNPHACATAKAAGHNRVQADVFSLPTAMALAGYIASPPCQPFSQAGKQAGLQALQHLLDALAKVADGATPHDAIAAVHDQALDVRSLLVLHPLTVIRDSLPAFVAMEQVPTVQPVWDAYADVLARWGYSVATGKVQAEQYGVPQTRRRAVLLASLDRDVTLPAPTHTRYVKGKPRERDGLLPWVSMADALSHPDPEAWTLQTPSMLRANDYSVARDLTAPAHTIALGHDASMLRWVPVAAVPGDTTWTEARPSPTIVGSFSPDVVAAPGYRKAGDGPRQSQPGSVRVTIEQAAVLQSFPADYPWSGPETARWQQVGNAVPPLLAAALLRQVL